MKCVSIDDICGFCAFGICCGAKDSGGCHDVLSLPESQEQHYQDLIRVQDGIIKGLNDQLMKRKPVNE